MNDLKNELFLAKQIAKKCKSIIDNEKNFSIISSDNDDIKLEVDKILNDFIVNELLKKSNISNIISEESLNDFELLQKNEYCWIIDPLDGSYNFIRGIPFYSTSICLWKGNKPVFGVVYDFINDDLLYFDPLKNASFLNEKKIVVNRKSLTIQTSCIGSGIPSLSNYSSNESSKFWIFLNKFKKIRFLGSASLTICNVVLSKLDVYYEKRIYIWDIAAALSIAIGAGLDYKISHCDSDMHRVDLIISRSDLLENIIQEISNEG